MSGYAFARLKRSGTSVKGHNARTDVLNDPFTNIPQPESAGITPPSSRKALAVRGETPAPQFSLLAPWKGGGLLEVVLGDKGIRAKGKG